MTPFTTLTAVAAPMPTANVDTDQIIPARYLPKPRPELKNGMFHDLRFNSDGSPKPDFVLNKPAYGNAQILVAERNFACGSSREHAVICMLDNGFRAFIAPSFGDIFFNNCFQNGCLPIVLPEARVNQLLRFLLELPGAEIAIDLAAQTVRGPDGQVDTFAVEPFRKECLLKGLDDIALTLQYEKDIAAFETQQKTETPWL
mgnify:CR=1 FL=1